MEVSISIEPRWTIDHYSDTFEIDDATLAGMTPGAVSRYIHQAAEDHVSNECPWGWDVPGMDFPADPPMLKVFRWPCKQQPPMAEIFTFITAITAAGHAPCTTEVDTSDDYAWVIASRPVSADEAFRLYQGS